jgi:hypothetical protein
MHRAFPKNGRVFDDDLIDRHIELRGSVGPFYVRHCWRE